MPETTPKDHLIILCEFLVGNKAHAMSSSIRAWVNCSWVSVKLHLSCTVNALHIAEPSDNKVIIDIQSYTDTLANAGRWLIS